ncbi:MAG TPA: right-handed parallel beta-helix repeat-containing protein [Paludibacter sp.]|nr:right-handed parallel beta-helix repeat-containing protein [Paludibacter sp.]
MKKLILSTIVILSTLTGFYSCQDSIIEEPTITSAEQARKWHNTAPNMALSTNALNIAAASGSTANFNITSNIAWTITSNQSWLTVNPATGNNNGAITLTASANTGTTPRVATVTVSGANVVSQTVTVTQATATAPTGSPYIASSPVVLNGVSNRIISYLQISNPNGNCITLSNCSNITIQYCKLGASSGEGISLQNCSNITIVYNYMESIRTGVYALSSTGVKIEHNDVKNVKGPMPRGQMVQFDKVTGAGNSISYNVAENIAGASYPEDVISTYLSGGTATDPLKVVGNKIRGGGPSTTGGGIMAGDNNGAYILIENNILINPGQYGMAVSGGHDIVVRNNKIYSAKFAYTNIGLYAWNQYSTPSYAITISNNEVNFTNKDGVVNNWWNAGNLGTITGWSTNVYNPNLNATALPTTILGQAEQQAIASKL